MRRTSYFKHVLPYLKLCSYLWLTRSRICTVL